MTRLTTIILAATCTFAAAAMADAPAPTPARRVLSPEDFYRIQNVGNPEVSPDGKWVAYTVSVNDKEANESRTQIYMVSWDGKERFALTNPAKGTNSPKFSPDGKYLSFMATPPGASNPQLMLLDRRGGEPRALTSTADDIGRIRLVARWQEVGAGHRGQR